MGDREDKFYLLKQLGRQCPSDSEYADWVLFPSPNWAVRVTHAALGTKPSNPQQLDDQCSTLRQMLAVWPGDLVTWRGFDFMDTDTGIIKSLWETKPWEKGNAAQVDVGKGKKVTVHVEAVYKDLGEVSVQSESGEVKTVSTDDLTRNVEDYMCYKPAPPSEVSGFPSGANDEKSDDSRVAMASKFGI